MPKISFSCGLDRMSLDAIRVQTHFFYQDNSLAIGAHLFYATFPALFFIFTLGNKASSFLYPADKLSLDAIRVQALFYIVHHPDQPGFMFHAHNGFLELPVHYQRGYQSK